MPDNLVRLQSGLADRYRITRELGRGGMATVYLAEDLRHQRPVAIKVLLPGLVQGTERFLREIQLTAALSHPHILPVYDSGAVGESPYYVMPFIDGESLRSRLDRENTLPVQEAVQIGREVADALAYAHAKGIVHRDIKPGNILLSSGHAVVADFGIARAIGAEGGGQITEVGAVIGSVMYMSPEQAEGVGELDGRSDIYSLGCVLYEVITGRTPFSGRTNHAIMVSRLLDQPVPLRSVRPDLPAGLEAVVAKAMAESPTQRFGTAAECAAALAMLETGVDPGLRLEPRAEPPSIAILPFVNLSPDPDNAYFSDGMTDELTGALTNLPGLRVAARTSAFAFKGRDEDVRQIGARLGVRHLLQGSVRKAGTRLRIGVQLIDASSGYQLWAETYDRNLENAFQLQDEISRTIAGELKLKLMAGPEAAVADRGTANMEAWTLCLRGRFHASSRTLDGLRQGIECLEKAVQLDPGYAAAWAELGSCRAMRGFDEYGDLPPAHTMPGARAEVEKALALDPSLGEAHAWLGVIALLYEWDPGRAERELVRALRLNPRYTLAHSWYALALTAMGRHDESILSATRGTTLDPMSPLAHLVLARCHYFARQFDEAVATVRTIMELDPRQHIGYVWLGRIHNARGRPGEALTPLLQGMEQAGPSPYLLALLVHTFGKLGRREEAAGALARLRDAGSGRWVSPMLEGFALIGLGDFEGALERVRAAYDQRSGFVIFTRQEPLWDTLRGDPRFSQLEQRLRSHTGRGPGGGDRPDEPQAGMAG